MTTEPFEWIDQYDLEKTTSGSYSDVVDPLCMNTDKDSSYGLLRIGKYVTPHHHVVMVDMAGTMKLFGRIHVARACIRRLVSTLSATDTLTLASFTRTLFPRTQMNQEGRDRVIQYLDESGSLMLSEKGHLDHGLHRVFREQLDTLSIMSDGYLDTSRISMEKCAKLLHNTIQAHPESSIQLYGMGEANNLKEWVGDLDVCELMTLPEIDNQWILPTRKIDTQVCVTLESVPRGVITFQANAGGAPCIPGRDGRLSIPIGTLEEGSNQDILFSMQRSMEGELITPQVKVTVYHSGEIAYTEQYPVSITQDKETETIWFARMKQRIAHAPTRATYRMLRKRLPELLDIQVRRDVSGLLDF